MIDNFKTAEGDVARLEFEPQVFSNQSHQLWTVQIGGWFGYAVFVFLAIIHPRIDVPGFNINGQLINLAIETFAGFLLSFFQWQLIQSIVHLPIKLTLFWSFFSASVLGLIYNIIKLSSYKVIVYDQRWNEAWDMLEFGGWLLFSLATMFVWTGIFFIMLYNTKLQKEHEMLLRAETKAKDAQLKMLRYQINPHFMFNTMNAISTLIYKSENDKANEMLDQLCEFFRHSLDQDIKSQTSLSKELELLDLYVGIEKVRFGDRLKFQRNIDPLAYSGMVPTMLLQPLVENSIKYAVEPNKGETRVSLIVRLKSGRVNISLVDEGNLLQTNEKQGMGIGLKNTNERLNTMFSGDYSIDFKVTQNVGSKLAISFPFVVSERK
ncbi:MAG: histidine kinase [Gammaproteobacteria bacterium]|nr:histidine kinase [Gammaproteobacteria bacterium]